jgi:small subunit ribosomal protein S8
MTLNDPLANTLSKMQNALKRGKESVVVLPVSDFIVSVLEILQQKGYVESVELTKDLRGNYVTIKSFQSINKVGVIKPRYDFTADEAISYEQRFLPAKGFGLIIVSTSKGLMTLQQAKELKIGGKLIAYCY